MNSYLSYNFKGNSLQEWLIATGIFIGSFIVARFIYWLSTKVIKKFTAKTETKLDDILIDMAEEPLVFAIVIFGFWHACHYLTLAKTTEWFIRNAYYFLIIFNIAWFFTRFLDAVIKEYFLPLAKKSASGLDDQLLPLIRKVLKVLVWIIAGIIAIDNAGYNVGALITGLGIGGLAFALAAQDTISNLFGGITIFTDKPFHVNDRVKVSGIDGFVREIGIRSSRIETLDGRIVTIPNSTFAKTPIENVSSEPSRKVTLKIFLPHKTDSTKIEKTLNLLKEIAKNNPNNEELVFVILDSFGHISYDILLIYFIKKSADIIDTTNEVNLEIIKQFTENNIELASPTQIIYQR